MWLPAIQPLEKAMPRFLVPVPMAVRVGRRHGPIQFRIGSDRCEPTKGERDELGRRKREKRERERERKRKTERRGLPEGLWLAVGWRKCRLRLRGVK